jgi:hypothetical protein
MLAAALPAPGRRLVTGHAGDALGHQENLNGSAGRRGGTAPEKAPGKRKNVSL